MMKRKRLTPQLMLGTKDQLDYYPFTDSGGNKLKSNEILFCFEEESEKQIVEIWGEEEEKQEVLTIDSPNVSYVFDESGNFPIALRTEDGSYASLKKSAKTGEILPYHAGCCALKSLIAVGPSASAKTVYTLQLTDPSFHDALAGGTELSLEDDLPPQAPGKQKYEKERDEFKSKILPEPSRCKDTINFFYYVRYGGKSILLKIEDIDGEHCLKTKLDSKIFNSNYLILTVGADELMASKRGEEVIYPKVLDGILPKLRVLRDKKDYEILVMITKSDCLDPEHPFLKDAYENSICVNDGRVEQITHMNGFNYEAFQKRSRCVQHYLKKECPNFYNKLTNNVSEEKLTFCMIASVGEECVDNHFENYKPFCIDEPILSILTRAGMYPVACSDSTYHSEKVMGYSKNGILGSCKKIFNSIVDTIVLENDWEEEEA